MHRNKNKRDISKKVKTVHADFIKRFNNICGFRQGRGCMDKMDKVFAVRQVCEKYHANGKDVFWAFMDLEKAYDTIDRHGMSQMLRVYGVGGKLLKAV